MSHTIGGIRYMKVRIRRWKRDMNALVRRRIERVQIMVVTERSEERIVACFGRRIDWRGRLVFRKGRVMMQGLKFGSGDGKVVGSWRENSSVVSSVWKVEFEIES